MGFIYLITNIIDNKQYVGQTTSTIEARFIQHKYSAVHYQKHIDNPELYAYKGTCTYLYRAMNHHGHDNFNITMLIECSDDSLDEQEIKFISDINTLAPNGYNLTTGGGHFQHCDETKQLIREKVRDVILNNIDNFRSSDKTMGLPPYIAYKIDGNYEAYYVNNHPLCERKYFSSSKYGTITAAKEACAAFVKNLNESGEKYNVTGPGDSPIKGLRTRKYGYQVRKGINGKIYEKSFNDPKLSREQNLQNALIYIQKLN